MYESNKVSKQIEPDLNVITKILTLIAEGISHYKHLGHRHTKENPNRSQNPNYRTDSNIL